MSLEQTAIATSLNDHDAYDLLQQAIEPDTFSEIGRLIYSAIAEFYSTEESASSADRGYIESVLCSKYRKSASAITSYLDSLPEPIGRAAAGKLAVQIKRSNLGDELLIALAKSDQLRAAELMEDYLEADQSSVESTLWNGQPFGDFFGKDTRGRLPFFPLAINGRLDGGIPRKSQVGICARPNIGKSTFLANLSACYAKNDYRVCYFTNEDSTEETAIRLIARLSGYARGRVEHDPEEPRIKAMEAGLGNIWVESLNPGSLPEIRSVLSAVRPDIFIVDQLYPIVTSAKAGPTLELANFASGTRRLAREFDCVSVIVTQRDKASGDRLWLKQEDAEWSSTGFAAQLDLMIGLARDDKMERTGRMMLSFPRWKFGPRIDPFEVKFDFQTCKVTA